MADTTPPAQVVECSSACTVQVVVQPMRAGQEDYEAASVIFGVLLTAAVLIACARKVMDLFLDRPES